MINSRADERIPFETAEQIARELEKRGRVVKFEALDGVTHYQMDRYVEPMRQAVGWITDAWAK
jgi:hypothetical protein